MLLYLDDNSFLRNFPNYSILQSQSWNPHTFVERIAGASKEFVDPLIRIRLLVYRCLMNSYRHMPRLLVFWISPYGPHTIYYTIDGQPLLGNPDNLYLNMRYRIKSTRKGSVTSIYYSFSITWQMPIKKTGAWHLSENNPETWYPLAIRDVPY